MTGLSSNATLNGDNVLIQRRPRTEVIARAADILEATLRDIDTDKGDVSAESWGSLLAVLAILRGDHEL